MGWQYLGDHWWEVAYWHFRSWVCDKLRTNCPSCAEAERGHELTKDMTDEEFAKWLEKR